ncbi:MAG: hypothetical protein ABL967_20330 [Bryobacteraceae bacterium]
MAWLVVGLASATGAQASMTTEAQKPTGISIDAHLNFGTLLRKSALQSATITIDPETGKRSIEGVDPPVGGVTLINENIRFLVDLIKTSEGSIILPATGALAVGIGGTIAVSPMVDDGSYRGRVVINVAYD